MWFICAAFLNKNALSLSVQNDWEGGYSPHAVFSVKTAPVNLLNASFLVVVSFWNCIPIDSS